MNTSRPRPPSRGPRRAGRRGFVLLAVLVFILLLSMVTISLLFSSRAGETAAAAGAGSEQAWLAALSGVQEALRVAASARPGDEEWADNPAVFREREVGEDGADVWRFTVYSPADSDSGGEVRHGLTDEARRINLARPGAADLTRIPRLTPAMNTALREVLGGSPAAGTSAAAPGPSAVAGLPPDPPVEVATTSGAGPWVDSIPEPGPGQGAGQGMPAWRGPLASVTDLARVPGFGPALVFGEDANRNGRLDPNENDGDEQFPPDNRDGILDHGMAQYFTLDSREPYRTRAGLPKVDLNDPAAAIPAEGLPASFPLYINALRAAGQRLGHPADTLEAVARVKDEQGREVEVASGIGREELPLVLDRFTAGGPGRPEALVNVNTAGASVLATLPGLDFALAETIVSTRSSLGPDQRASTAWLFREGLVDAARFRTLAPHLTTRSYQFTFQVIGYGLPSGRYRLLEAAIDVSGDEPRLLRLKEITGRGLPFALEAAGEGQAPAASSIRRGPAAGRSSPRLALAFPALSHPHD